MSVCKKPNFTSTNRISIVINSDDNVNSLTQKFLEKNWSFAVSKNESQDPDGWETSVDIYLSSIDRYLKNKGINQEDINQVKENVKNSILSNSIEVEENDDNEAEIPDAELDTSKQKTEIKLSTQLRNIFGDDRILSDNFQKEFKYC